MSSLTHDWWRPKPVRGAALGRPRRSDLPYWGLLGFTLVLLLSPQTMMPFLKPLRPAMLAAGLAIGAVVLERFLTRRRIFVAEREVWLALTLVVWSLLTMPFSVWPGGAFEVLKTNFIKSVMIFWLISTVVDTERRLRNLFWLLSVVSVLLSITAIKNYVQGVFISGHAVERIVGFDAPLTANPNDLALMLLLIAPMVVAVALTTHKRSVRWFLSGVLGLLVVAVIATFSRAGFIVMVTLFGIYVVKMLDGPKKSWALAAVAAAFLALPLLPARFVGHLETITDSSTDTTGSAQARWTDAEAATRYIADNPLIGAGLGMHTTAIVPYGGTWRAAHNVYLEQAADLGLPGLALFVWMLVGCWRGVRRAQRSSVRHAPALYRMTEALELSIAAFALGAMFHPISYHFYFYYIAGLAVAARTIADGLQGGRAWAK
jgi:O-antigen ligase